MKYLVITESPKKQKDLAKYLKNISLKGNFSICATVGHIICVKEKGLSIEIENNYNPIWQQSKEKSKVITELKKKIKEADHVYIATDPDLAGEFIAWSVLYVCKLKDDNYNRVTFNSITQDAVKQGFDLTIQTNRKIDMNKVYAEQTRIILDRLIGFGLSPLVRQIVSGESAGRCQSPITRLVCEKQKEIDDFVPTNKFTVEGSFLYKSHQISTKLSKDFDKEEKLMKVLKIAKDATFYIKDVKKSSHTKKTPLPYKTRTLLTDVSSKTGMSVKSITACLQALYMKGYITYIRTDSTSIDKSAIPKIKDTVVNLYNSDDIDKSKLKSLEMKNVKKKGNSEQLGHECLRVTDTNRSFDEIDNASQRKIYIWIWKRTLASIMKPQQYDTYSINIYMKGVKSPYFVGSVDDVTYEGFMKVYNDYDTSGNKVEKKENNELVKVFQKLMKKDENVKVDCREITASESLTNPPSYFSEATLLSKMDDMGIGRPSTYASIMRTIIDRKYVQNFSSLGKDTKLKKFLVKDGNIEESSFTKKIGVVKNKLKPTPLGLNVVEYLCKDFDGIMEYSYTSKLEKDIIDVESGKSDWVDVVDKFYKEFSPIIEETKKKYKKDPNHHKKKLGMYKDKEVYVYKAKFDPVVQHGATKPRYVKIPKDKKWDKLTLEQAIKLLNEKPKDVHEGKEVVEYNKKKYYIMSSIGKFGPFISLTLLDAKKTDKPVFYSLKGQLDDSESYEKLSVKRMMEIIKGMDDEKKQNSFENYGDYAVELKVGKKDARKYIFMKNIKKKARPVFVSIPKDIDPEQITQEQVTELIKKKMDK